MDRLKDKQKTDSETERQPDGEGFALMRDVLVFGMVLTNRKVKIKTDIQTDLGSDEGDVGHAHGADKADRQTDRQTD